MNTIRLNKILSRVEIVARVNGEQFLVWIDTGSPNTLVPTDFTERLKLSPNKGKVYSGRIAGTLFSKRPSITIPKIVISGCHPLRSVRAITALEGDEWKDIIIIGLNVLNHLTYKINRDPFPGTLEWLESLTSEISGSSRTRFDHLIMDGKYLLSDGENE